jgi:outer membrane receptor for ferrienterochelin and colicins
MRLLISAGLALAFATGGEPADAAQPPTGTIRVEVIAASRPAIGATVSAGGASTSTNPSGIATLTLTAGPVDVVATRVGYGMATARVNVAAGAERAVRLILTPPGQDQNPVVTSTRTSQGIEDQAVPVEVVRRDSIERAMLMAPGNMARSLDEIAGLRVQTTSPELGLAMLRMRGLPGQYTRLLSDGVPRYFDHPGGLALLQMPPMDLDRIEVIKDSASALFGANATAGVVNLLSRRPSSEPSREFLFSQSIRGGTDGALWLASPQTGSWGRTFLVSAHRQEETDVNDDGWSDLPGYSRGVVRQGVFWDNGSRSVWGNAGVTFEKREGGSAAAHQQLETKIADGILSGQMRLGRYILAGAGSLYVQSHVRDFSDRREHDRREAATIEITLRGSAPRQSWVAGIAADWFTVRTPEPLASAYVAPRGGIFVHDDVDVAPWLLLSGSARLDYSKGASEALRLDKYFFSPRGSAKVHGGPWSARISAGRSYYVPTTLMEETEAAGFARLTIDAPLDVETARSVSADVAHETGATSVGLTVFESHIDNPARMDRATYTLRTEPEPVSTRGVELLGRARRAPFAVTATYAYVRAREGGGRDVALTPRHSAGAVLMAEAKDRGRVAAKVSYTDAQPLDANPYRTMSEPYVLVGLLAEHRLGRWRVFVNAENLTDVRQTRWDPIARPSRDVDGRWTVDVWAPLEGRVINAGIRIPF